MGQSGIICENGECPVFEARLKTWGWVMGVKDATSADGTKMQEEWRGAFYERINDQLNIKP